MKRTRKLLSLLLAALTLLSLMPMLTPPASAEDDTDITIDFNYEKEHNVKSREDALALTAGSKLHTTWASSLDELEELFEQTDENGDPVDYKWQKASIWTVKDKDTRSLRDLLTSTDPDDKYIALNQDDDHSYYKSDLWRTIEITEDKVLDLNGKQIDIRYDSNRSNDEPSQTDRIEYHNCTAFEIKKGATLTIIDSSAWRGEGEDGKGTGRISFTGYAVNPFNHKINSYTTRDLFKVTNGNLVIYGGTFQAGRQKSFYKDNFTWEKLRTTIGTAVELGVNIAEYATGLDAASSSYKDLLESEKSTDLNSAQTTTGDEDDGSSGIGSTQKRDGSDAPKESAKDSPSGAGNGLKTVDEKQADKSDGEKNRANDKKTGKDDKNTKLAEGRKNIVDSAVNQKGIMGMVNKIFSLGKNIAGMVGKDKDSFCVEYILGTVVKVDNGSTFVSYGGTYHGYGSTPNTRNAVIEVNYQPGTEMPFDKSKNKGGLVYIYDGLFEGFGGANIFNFVRAKAGTQYGSQIMVGENGERPQEMVNGELVDKKSTVALDETETGGVEVFYYDNQEQAGTPGFEPKLVNTAGVQVRGGTFRNHFELQNVAIRQPDDKENFTKFPGTRGCVNLGIESYGEDLIRDGRIQIVDKYYDGALVLLDRQTQEREDAIAAGQTFTEGLYRYRLLCGDLELRSKPYLEVYPNNDADTNSAKSMMLATYSGEGKPESLLWTDDDDNIRAAQSQTENYFDFIYDRGDAENYYIMPMFHDPDSKDRLYPEFSQWTTDLDTSELWYYPTPRYYSGQKMKATPYAEAMYTGIHKSSGDWMTINQMTCGDKVYEYGKDPDPSTLFPQDGWWWYGVNEWTQMVNNIYISSYKFNKYDDIRTAQRYFTYKVYRVDPLSRENIVESGVYGEDSPLISVRYGSSDDSLKCKLPLLQVEQQIKQRQIDDGVPESERWQGFRSGELYRVTLTVEEDVVFGPDNGDGTFGGQLETAVCNSSILFRCVSLNDKVTDTSTGTPQVKYDFSPLQWNEAPEANSRAMVSLLNGKAGMTDFIGANKVFDVYYQWWETDADGKPLRLLAGTDNVLSTLTQAARSEHHPSNWLPELDRFTYENTREPGAPNSSYYQYHGLPSNTDGTPRNDDWTCYDLHMCSAQLIQPGDLTLGPGNLSPRNNNVYATNFDNCYIPADMAGKYIQVKAIVLNPQWGGYFDQKQTFLSRVMQVKPEQKLEGSVTLNYEGTVLYGTELKFTRTGAVAAIPASKLKLQWQTCLAESYNFRDIAGATGSAYRIPTDPGNRKVKYRLAVSVDGYREPLYSNIVFADSIYPLKAQDYTFPATDRNEAASGSVDLSSQVSGGSGLYYITKESGPEWVTLNGNVLSYNRPVDAKTSTVKLRVTDMSVDDEATFTVTIPTYKTKHGTLTLEGTPRYSGDPDNPNVLTADVVGGNGNNYMFYWKLDGKTVSYGLNNRYEIKRSDIGRTLSCQVVDWDNDPIDYYSPWYKEVKILGVLGPKAPKLEGGAPSKEDNSNGYITVTEGTYPLEISRSASFSTVLKTIYSGNFYELPVGTYYVRSAAIPDREVGEYASVVVPDHSAYLHCEGISVIPYGVGGDNYEMFFKIDGGKLPYTVSVSTVRFSNGLPNTAENAHYIETTATVDYVYDFDAGERWWTCKDFRFHGQFPRYMPANSYNEAWASFGHTYLVIEDGDGNKIFQHIDFEGFRGNYNTFFQPAFTDHVTFHDVDYGYDAIGALEGPFVVWSFKNGEYLPKDKISFYLDDESKDKFDVTWSLGSEDMLKPADTYYVFVTPEPGLPAGTYTPKVYMRHSDYADKYWESWYATVTFNVVPIALDDCTISEIVNKEYTGEPIEQDIVVTAPNGTLLTEGVDYTVTYENNVNAGKVDQYGNVKPEDEAVCIITGIGSCRGTWRITYMIEQATTSTRTKDVYVRCDTTERQLIPVLEMLPAGYGTLNAFTFSRADDEKHLIAKVGRDTNNNTLYFEATGTAQPGDTAALKGVASVTNYLAPQYTVIVHFVDKDMPAVAMDDLTVTYTGQPLAANKIPGTVSFGSEIVSGKWSFAEPDSSLLKNAHEAVDIPVIFTPDDTDRFMEVSATFRLIISPTPVTGEPAFKEITSEGMTLADTGISTVGSSFPVPGVVYYDLPENTPIQPNQAYTWYFVPSSGNYGYVSGTVIPWKTAACQKGDVNMDGSVSNADLILVARYVVRLTTFTSEAFKLGDMDARGDIDNKDIIRLARLIVGLV